MDPNGFPMQPPQQLPAGYPVPTQSPQQFPYYPNAMPSFPQPKNQQQQHSFGAMPMQHAGPGGAMMPTGYPQQSPASSPAAAREKARVSALLDINSMLLQEVVNLQAAGKAGSASTQPGSQDSNNPSPLSEQASDATKGSAQRPSQEYVDCMRRLQANLAYLATIADRAKKSGGVAPQAPNIMTPPPHMPSMNDIYTKLNELFPRIAQGASGTPQPSPQAIHGNGNPSPSAMTDSMV
ncbi:hypothetical protein FE257_011034 [Aspergillus nanangensis]|uniref:Uncharacterized protein n=1 Tax=Aspergillus nanangensis TaxID=2582783 RepID=A0AAD4CI26_ASPNN|nr:hypothetical protein FE257_011034 [Aspergillus nanangensis]